jgi:hypothetical protein
VEVIHVDRSRKRGLHVITNSEVECFRTCRARHGFQYIEGLRPLVTAAPLSFGTIYHAGAAAGWRAAWQEAVCSLEVRAQRATEAALVAVSDAVAEALVEAKGQPDEVSDEIVEHKRVAQWAVSHYFDKCRADLRMVPLAIEAPFQVPVVDSNGSARSLRHSGVVDLLLWDPEEGLIILQDHKTTGGQVDSLQKKLPLDTQMSGYMRAAIQLLKKFPKSGVDHESMPPGAWEAASSHKDKIRSAGLGPVVFNVVRRAMPEEPKVNLLRLPKAQAVLHTPIADLLRAQETDGVPRGEVSSAAIDTTADVYAAALERQARERHQDITEKQNARLAELSARPDTYLAQLEFYRGPDELERWRREMWVESRLMRQSEADPSMRTRNPAACSLPQSPRCVYSALCQDPTNPVARAEFRVAGNRHEEVSAAHDGLQQRGDRDRGREADPGFGEVGVGF